MVVRSTRFVVWAIALVALPTIQQTSAAVLSEWTFRNPVPSNADLYNGAFGNGVYVLVGRGTGVHRTPDLHNWTSDYPGTDVANVIFAEGMFTISGSSGQILRSTDAEIWTRYDTGLDAPLYGLAFSGDRYVAVGDGGVTATSVNGRDWTTGSIGDGNFYGSVAAGEGRFVAVSGQGTVATSTDGTTWSETSLEAEVPGYLELYVVAYGAGRFLAGGYFWDELTSNEGAVVLSSEDGLAWSLVTDPNIPQDANNPENNQYWIDEIKYDGSQFVATGDSGLILVWTDGLTWSTRFPNTTRDLLGLAFGPAGTVVFGSGGNYFVSQDLMGWEVGNPDVGLGLGRWEVIEHNGTQYLLAGLLGLVAHSDDGVSWSGEHRGGATGTYSDATYGNGLGVATSLQTSDGVCVVTSSDGVEWTRPALPAGVLRCGGVAFGNGTFVATVSDASPIIVTSADGST